MGDELCRKCKKQIKNEEDSATCSICSLKFHATCAGVTTKNKKWKCSTCSAESPIPKDVPKTEDLGNSEVLGAIKEFRKENRELWRKNDEKWEQTNAKLGQVQSEIEVTKQQISQISNKIVEVTNKCESACKSVDEIQRENNQLKKEIKSVKEQLSDLQQHTRKNNIIISGVPMSNREDIIFVLQEISRVLNINFYYSDVSAAHRLQGKRGDARPPAIVVNFISRFTKTLWLNARRQKGSLIARELNASLPDTPIYINEHLTPETRKVFNAARELAKSNLILSVWTRDCKVMVRAAADKPPFRVHDMDQLTRLREQKDDIAAPACEEVTEAAPATAPKATPQTLAVTKPPTARQPHVSTTKK